MIQNKQEVEQKKEVHSISSLIEGDFIKASKLYQNYETTDSRYDWLYGKKRNCKQKSKD